MVWDRRMIQNVSLLLFQLAEDVKPHGQQGQQHPQAQKALGITKVDIGIGSQADEPCQNGKYHSLQIHRAQLPPIYFPTDVPERV